MGLRPIRRAFSPGVSSRGKPKSNENIKEADKDGLLIIMTTNTIRESCEKDCTEKHENKHIEGEECGKDSTENQEHKHGEKKVSYMQEKGFTSM